jgi:hypothetical protein
VDLEKQKFSNFYQTEPLWWELYDRECVVCLTDVNREGADIERVSAQEHDTDSAIHVSVYCGIFHLQYEFPCNFIRYNFVLLAVFEALTALSVGYCNFRYDAENLYTNRQWRMKLSELAFSLRSLPVNCATPTYFLPLSNCDTALAANSVSSKDLISRCAYL